MLSIWTGLRFCRSVKSYKGVDCLDFCCKNGSIQRISFVSNDLNTDVSMT